MTLYEYKLLSEHDQYDTVFTKGQFLDTVTDGSTKIVLYAIDKSFIEVAYDVPTNKIKGTRGFMSL
jgi:hypothetical protein